MATVRLRPGTWTLVNGSGTDEKFYLDNNTFVLRGNKELTMDARISIRYSDTNVDAYRTPPTPQTVISNVGDEFVEKVSKAPTLSIKEVF